MKRLLLVLILLTVLASGAAAWVGQDGLLAAAGSSAAWTSANQNLAMLLFVPLLVLWSLILPTMVPIILAGFWFGPIWGNVLVTLATTLAFVTAFHLGSRLEAGQRDAWLQHRPRLSAWHRSAVHYGWRLVLLMRLSPVLPFHVQNYLYGAAGMDFRSCLIATVLGKQPNLIVTVLLGHAARSGMEQGWSGGWSQLLGLVAGGLVVVLLGWRARRELTALEPVTMT